MHLHRLRVLILHRVIRAGRRVQGRGANHAPLAGILALLLLQGIGRGDGILSLLWRAEYLCIKSLDFTRLLRRGRGHRCRRRCASLLLLLLLPEDRRRGYFKRGSRACR